MVHEEQAGGGWVAGVAQPPMWPPEGDGSYRPGSHDFMAKCARSGGRSVEWPPRGDEVYGSSPALNSYGQQQVAPPVPPRPRQYPLQAHSSAPNLLEEEAVQPKTFQRQPPSISSSPFSRKSAAVAPLPRMDTSSSQQSGSEGNLTTVYPSNFKLRSEMPVQQEPAKVFSSQPAFKSTRPIRMRGDSKWPPTQGSSEDTSQEQQVREFIKPRKQCKDYSTFFAQNALPSSYTGYRAPPGTQHVGVADEDAVDM